MDANSGQVIAAYNQDQRREPASLTKLMTAYVVFHALKDGVIHLDDTAAVSERAWRMGGSRMFAQLGSHISVEELLQGMIVQSGNDATVALGGTRGRQRRCLRLHHEPVRGQARHEGQPLH